MNEHYAVGQFKLRVPTYHVRLRTFQYSYINYYYEVHSLHTYARFVTALTNEIRA